MEIRIQSIRFDATEQLKAFIEKKTSKLEKAYEGIQKADITLKVVKPATAMNKEVDMAITAPGVHLYVEKVCDTFEEGVDLCVDSMKVQLAKFKEKSRER